jgi:hypothetical protein
LPSGVVDEIASRKGLPAGLSDYTAALDWPASLREQLGLPFKSEANIGLGLRWVAALDSLSSYVPIPEARQARIIDRSVREVRERASRVAGLAFHPDDDEHIVARSIVSVTPLSPDKAFVPLIAAHNIRKLLQAPDQGPVCHVGQPVRVGPRAVLRISASARDVIDVAARMDTTRSFDDAFAPLAAKLDRLFEKWARLPKEIQTA